jgi:hypothetical protein
MRVLGATLAAVLLASGCGANHAPADGPTYKDPAAVITELSIKVVLCDPAGAGGPTATVYSDRAQSCFYTAADGVDDSMTAATFTTREQQEQGVRYLVDSNINPGMVYVQGNKWLVMTTPQLAPKVAKALGGTIVDQDS